MPAFLTRVVAEKSSESISSNGALRLCLANGKESRITFLSDTSSRSKLIVVNSQSANNEMQSILGSEDVVGNTRTKSWCPYDFLYLSDAISFTRLNHINKFNNIFWACRFRLMLSLRVRV